MNGCNFCDKKGLLIYPVRYAVASPYGAAGGRDAMQKSSGSRRKSMVRIRPLASRLLKTRHGMT